MDRIWQSGAAVTPPSFPASPSVGYPQEITGSRSTVPGAWWYHAVTEEIRNAIVAGGVTPDAGATDQLRAAIQAMIASSVAPFSVPGAGTGAAKSAYLPGGSLPASRTVQQRLRDQDSVLDRAATYADGATSDTAGFTAAGSVGAVNDVLVPARDYVFATMPTPTGLVVYDVAAGATFSGAAASSIGLQNTKGRQRVYWGSAPDQFAADYIRRQVTHAGGSPGFASSSFRVDTYVPNGATDFCWGITSFLDTSAAGGENVALQGTTFARAAGGPAWAMSLVLRDYSANPTAGKVVLEPTIEGNGNDDNGARINVDVAGRRPNLAGADAVFHAAFRAQAGGDEAHVTYRNLLTTTVGLKLIDGVSTHAAVVQGSAFKMAQGQVFSFNADATRQMTHYGNGLLFKGDAGAPLWELRDNGALLFGGVQLLGAQNTGWTAGTGTLTSAKGPFNAETATLLETARRVAAIDNLLIGHGLAGA